MKTGPKPRLDAIRNKHGQIVCEHGKLKHQCVKCVGSGICEHKKRRHVCRDCKLLGLGGNSLCHHLKRKIRCELCASSEDFLKHKEQSICEHEKEKRQCVLCRPESAFRRMARRSQRDRGLTFNISYEQFLLLVNSDCYYCGDKSPNGIDRVNNTVGYELSNCRSCCDICNTMKLDHSEQMFFEHVRKILNRHSTTIGK